MTRDRSGRGPRSTRRTTPKSQKSTGDPRSAPEGSSRVTPAVRGSERTAGQRRSTLVRIGVLVFVGLILVAMILGCAPYDGDEAAFCDGLRRAPSFAELSAQVQDGTDEEAAAEMTDAAAVFRSLERDAPRSIRHTVASLGDSAERIAAELGPDAADTQTVTVYNDDGTVTELEIPGQPNRIGAFYTELQQHHGTISAVYSLMSYARDTCGITDRDVDLGMVGFGPAEAYQPELGGSGFSDDPFGEPGRFDGPGPFGEPGDNGVVIAPPATSEP